MIQTIKYSCGNAIGKTACEVDMMNRVFITQLKGVRIYISMDSGKVVKEEIIK